MWRSDWSSLEPGCRRAVLPHLARDLYCIQTFYGEENSLNHSPRSNSLLPDFAWNQCFVLEEPGNLFLAASLQLSIPNGHHRVGLRRCDRSIPLVEGSSVSCKARRTGSIIRDIHHNTSIYCTRIWRIWHWNCFRPDPWGTRRFANCHRECC